MPGSLFWKFVKFRFLNLTLSFLKNSTSVIKLVKIFSTFTKLLYRSNKLGNLYKISGSCTQLLKKYIRITSFTFWFLFVYKKSITDEKLKNLSILILSLLYYEQFHYRLRQSHLIYQNIHL